ncbi:hypothetical protein [Streptomyces kurssanovii]|uniref:DUF4148 domain-containing protein n=1 Tax=Streptomyces kurssanovii TaxID=67312 RepID=A0ABV3I222_9ACTN
MKKLIASAAVVAGGAALIVSAQGSALAAPVAQNPGVVTSTHGTKSEQWVGSAALKAANLATNAAKATRAAKAAGVRGDESARAHIPAPGVDAAVVFDK